MPEESYRLRWPLGHAPSHRKLALLLRAQAREAHSPETRAELERLALLYERLAARRKPGTTLGDLVGESTGPTVAESQWSTLLQCIASGDAAALQTLYLWTHRFVFSFVMGITNDLFAAEELTLLLYQEVWLEAAGYDPAEDMVIAWMLNKVRARAGVPAAERSGASGEVLAAVERARKLAELSAVGAIEDEPGMEARGAGIYTRLLASDRARGRLGMVVRLVPGAAYPPHVHAGVEQLYLLQGELWIDARKLSPGDYSRAEPATADTRVWSEGGCTCILVTSSGDFLETA